MPSHFDRIEFAPPPPGGLIRGWGLAVLAHGALLAALAWGVHWKRDAVMTSTEAELWAALPQQAAPREAPAPPPPLPPVATPQAAPAPPAVPDPQIALERERKAREAREAAEAQQRERDRKRRLDAQRNREEEQAKQAEARKREADQRRRDLEAQEKKLAHLREENLRRMQGLAGASGAPDARGAALQSAGPSPGWAGRVQAKVRPNIVFTEDIAGNPKAEVEVRLAPDGTIVGKRLVRSSGVKAWDEAVLRALDKTETLPRDTDGRVPTPVVIEFRPRG